MKQSLRILHVEDSPYDSELVQYMLRKNDFDCKVHRVATRDELFDKLEHFDYDLILADYTMPMLSGSQALEIARALKPQVPFIFVSGTIGEETAIESLQNGATDYVLKHRIDKLVPAIRRALAEAAERTMLRAMKKRLREARRLETIGAVAGGLARDFNNLLQIFRVNLDLLHLQGGHSEQVLKTVETLSKVTDRGSQLIDELLIFARKSPAHFALFNIATRINETAEVLRTGLPSNVKLVLHLDQGLPPIFADPYQVRHILTNLITNAKDAMPQGGCITVSAEIVEIDSASPRSVQSDAVRYLCLKVSDTGKGMDAPTRLHAFDPFFTTKSSEQGTGLGLSVVFELMQVHSGLIDLQSEVGKGTVISLFFPLPQGSKIDSKMIKRIPPFQLLQDANHSYAIPT